MWLNRAFCVLRPVWGLYWDFKVEGDTVSLPREGPLILVANHSCFLDPWFVAILFPRPGIHFLITRRWYERSAAWTWFFRAQAAIPVSPGDPAATSTTVMEVLGRGGIICIFPEGKISEDGKVKRFRSGAAWIAARSGAPVVPLGVRGAYESLPRTRSFPKRGPVSLHIGSPMAFPGSPVSGSLDPPALVEFRSRLREAVMELAGQAEAETEAPAAPASTVG